MSLLRKVILPQGGGGGAKVAFKLVDSWQQSDWFVVTYLDALRDDQEGEVAMDFPSPALIGSKQSSVAVNTNSVTLVDDTEAVLP